MGQEDKQIKQGIYQKFRSQSIGLGRAVGGNVELTSHLTLTCAMACSLCALIESPTSSHRAAPSRCSRVTYIALAAALSSALVFRRPLNGSSVNSTSGAPFLGLIHTHSNITQTWCATLELSMRHTCTTIVLLRPAP